MIRVTQVLEYFPEPELVAWQLRVGKVKAQQVGDEAKRIGSLVDKLIQVDINTGHLVIPAGELAVESCLNGWVKFKQERPEKIASIRAIQTELTDQEVVGHPDIEADEAEAWSIGDIKTSSMIRPKYWTQVAKYGQMKSLQGIVPVKPWYVWILRLDKTRHDYEYQELRGDKVMYEIEMWNHYWAIFRHAQMVQDWQRMQKEEEMLDVA